MKKLLAMMMVMLGIGLLADSGLNLGVVSAYQRHLGQLHDKINKAKPTLTMTPTISPTFTVSSTISPTSTATPSVTTTFSATVTPTLTATPSSSATVTPTLTVTPSITETSTCTITPSITVTSTITCTLTPIITVFLGASSFAYGPGAICVDKGGVVYWADSKSPSYFYYDTGTAQVAAVSPIVETPALRVCDVAIDDAGNVYTIVRRTTTNAGKLLKNTSSMTDWIWGNPGALLGLYVQPSGQKLCLNSVGGASFVSGTAQMWECPIWLVTTGETVAGAEFAPQQGGVCMDAAGNAYANDYRQNRILKMVPGAGLKILSGNGAEITDTVYSVVNASPIVQLVGLTIDPSSGNLFASCKDGLVYKITTDGTVSVITSGYGELGGICFDASSNSLYVAGTLDKEIIKIHFQ